MLRARPPFASPTSSDPTPGRAPSRGRLLARVVAVAASVSASATVFAPAPTRAASPDFERLERGVVKIEHSVYGVPTVIGSGFFVTTTGLILTNRHVLMPYFGGMGVSTLSVITRAGKAYKDSQIEYVACSDLPSLDACILRVKDKPLYSFSLEPAPLRKGQKIFAIGHPFGLEFTLSDGIVSGYQSLDISLANFLESRSDSPRNVEFLQMTTPASPGNSGGPVIDESGKVAGMTTVAVTLQYAQNLNFAVSASELAAFLRAQGTAKATPIPAVRATLQARQRADDEKLYASVVQPAIETANHGRLPGTQWSTQSMRAGAESFEVSVPRSFTCQPVAGKDARAALNCLHPTLGSIVLTLSDRDVPAILGNQGKVVVPARTLPFVESFMKTARWKEVSPALTPEHRRYLATVPSPARCFAAGWAAAPIGQWPVCRFNIYNDPEVGGESLILQAQSPSSAQVFTVVGQATSAQRKAVVHGMAEIVLRSYRPAAPELSPAARVPAGNP